MFFRSVSCGFESPLVLAFNWFGFAVGPFIGFFVFLRLGELTRWCSTCISFGADGNGHRVANIAVIAPKAWRYMGRHQIATVDEKHTDWWLVCWEPHPQCRVFLVPRDFARRFHQVRWAAPAWM